MDKTFIIGGKSILVSEEDAHLLVNLKWYLIPARQLDEKYYAATYMSGKTEYLHRIIADAKDGEIIGHINRNPLDCRRENLRSITPSLNRINSEPRGKRKHNLPKGVFAKSRGNTFYSRIVYKGKSIHLGSFKCPYEAERVYRDKLKEMFPHI